jgi:hypothetical protein
MGPVREGPHRAPCRHKCREPRGQRGSRTMDRVDQLTLKTVFSVHLTNCESAAGRYLSFTR